MYVLHGTWLPTNQFFAWGEGEAPPRTEQDDAAPGDGAAPLHPRLVSTATLHDALAGVIEAITPDDARGYFQHCGYGRYAAP